MEETHADRAPSAPFSLRRDWFNPPYVRDNPIDLEAMRAIPSAKARARRIRQAVAARNPSLPHNTIKFGRLVTTLIDLTNPKPPPRRRRP